MGMKMKWAHRMVRLLGAAGLIVSAWRNTEDIRAVSGTRCALAFQRRAVRFATLSEQL